MHVARGRVTHLVPRQQPAAMEQDGKLVCHRVIPHRWRIIRRTVRQTFQHGLCRRQIATPAEQASMQPADADTCGIIFQQGGKRCIDTCVFTHFLPRPRPHAQVRHRESGLR
ncbi:hypothetical protein AA0616_2607 [Komagataeibacter nataicola NRIC 0616]|nr:hypothetical protein AA0616_2607 [Komagataeibacter nataicola NRIC 0616]